MKSCACILIKLTRSSKAQSVWSIILAIAIEELICYYRHNTTMNFTRLKSANIILAFKMSHDIVSDQWFTVDKENINATNAYS